MASQALVVCQEGLLELVFRHQLRSINARTVFSFSRQPNLEIQSGEHLRLQTGGLPASTEYFIRPSPGSALVPVIAAPSPERAAQGGKTSWHFYPVSSPICVDSADLLTEIRFYLVNGNSLWLGRRPDSFENATVCLESKQWLLKFRSPEQESRSRFISAETALYRCTHFASITRHGQEKFTCEMGHTVLDALAVFFSFAIGKQVAPAFVEGFNSEAQVAMQEWGSREIDASTPVPDMARLTKMEQYLIAFPRFLELWENPLNRKLLASAVRAISTQSLRQRPFERLTLLIAVIQGLCARVLDKGHSPAPGNMSSSDLGQMIRDALSEITLRGDPVFPEALASLIAKFADVETHRVFAPLNDLGLLARSRPKFLEESWQAEMQVLETCVDCLLLNSFETP